MQSTVCKNKINHYLCKHNTKTENTEQMEAFFRTHAYLVDHTHAPVRRVLMDEIDWNGRMIGIKGTRGVGKTTFLLQYAKERFGADDRRCLYVNMNNFYFQGHGIADFAGDFASQGGQVLLIDQVFKQPNWSHELRQCYDKYPNLKIVFTGSSVMRLKDDYPELRGIVQSYNLRGFSFREFVNLKAGMHFNAVSLSDILDYPEDVAQSILKDIHPLHYFGDYLQHGFYPFFLENRNFMENLLKTMNMMTEVDILLIKQIELKYLTKIKRLLYFLAVEGPKAPNISQLANLIDTSRATVMNYIKYLADARLINIIYPPGQQFPKKPSKVMMHNPNLMYAIYPIQVNEQEVMETFFVNTLWKDHQVNDSKTAQCYIVDGKYKFKIESAFEKVKQRNRGETVTACYGTEKLCKGTIPLWLLGFVY